MNLVLDNIIFSLQKAGGASVLWQQHIERLIEDKRFAPFFLEYNNAKQNFFRNQISIDTNLIDLRNSDFLSIKRYLNLNSLNNNKHLFHSSHYRLEYGKNVINVTTVHDFTYEHFVKGFRKKVHSYQKNLAINGSNGIICVSESTKKDLLRFLPETKKDKIKVIYNGVDEVFRPLEGIVDFRKGHSFEDYSYLLYIGDRKTLYKNFNMAVNATYLSKKPLLIIGGGELTKEEAHFLKHKLGSGNFEILLGVSVTDLNYYYNKAFCLLYPSLYEGFGIPVVEAQRAGCPVVATNSSSIPEVIGNKYLMVANPTSQEFFCKIKELEFTNDLRKESIESGFAKSKKFSWKNTYEETTEFYKQLYFEK